MSSYHSSFKYLDQKSDEKFGWIIAHFDPDNGETDSYLSQEQVYSDSYNGTKRTLYGTKYNSVANVKITVVKRDGSDFTLTECRNAYKWLTGNPEASWMDLYIGDEVKYRLLCTIQDVKPQKMDARTVGLNIYCESLSPWAYSPQITRSYPIVGSETIEIYNESDDLYTYIYPHIKYTNNSSDSLIIKNKSIGETTQVDNIDTNEIVTLDSNMMISSQHWAEAASVGEDTKGIYYVSDETSEDGYTKVSLPEDYVDGVKYYTLKTNRVFGNDFNFVFPRLKAGNNVLEITADGEVKFEYYFPIKMGDCSTDINVVRDPICDDSGSIQVDKLPWNRVSDTPTTIEGYGIKNAYTKTEVDEMFTNLDISDIDTYSKSEIDAKLANITVSGVDINEDELNAMLAEVLV